MARPVYIVLSVADNRPASVNQSGATCLLLYGSVCADATAVIPAIAHTASPLILVQIAALARTCAAHTKAIHMLAAMLFSRYTYNVLRLVAMCYFKFVYAVLCGILRYLSFVIFS